MIEKIRVILVDDEPLSIEALEYSLKKIEDVMITGSFSNGRDAINFLKKSKVDLVFLDVQMPEISGIALAKELKKIQSELDIIFVTGFNHYAAEAFEVQALGYVLKPFRTEAIEKEIEKYRIVKKIKKRIRIKTFGRFDVFSENYPIIFKGAKAKELFALCIVRRGGIVTMEEAIDLLWENRLFDKKTKGLYRKAIMQIKQAFSEAGIQNVFENVRGGCHVNFEEIECDYYQLLKKDPIAINNFHGEFLIDYSWGEKTLGIIEEFLKQ